MSTESVGPFLKHARETQGLSLEQVASATRIQLKYLQALEEEQFSVLPEPVFTKGFVRTYARSLGIDEQDVLQRFSQAWNEYFGRGQEETDRAPLPAREETRGKPNRTVMIIIILVVVLGIGLFLSRQQQPNIPPTPETQKIPAVSSPSPTEKNETEPPAGPTRAEQPSQPDVDVESTTDSAEPDLPPVTLPTVTAQPKTVTPPTPPVSTTPGPLLMELEATQLTWVVVKSDQNKPEEALLQPNQRTTWKAKEQFTLTLGNAGGVRVWLNGKSRGPFGKKGQIVRKVVLR